MVSFNFWYNNIADIADIPAIVGGEWVDIETGIAFTTARNSAAAAKNVAVDAKEAAALLRPLRGNAKAEAMAKRDRLLPSQMIALSRATHPAAKAALESAVSMLSALTEKSSKGDFEAAFAENSEASRICNKIKNGE